MNEHVRHSQTKKALIWSNLLSEPLFTLYGFLVFFLYKDLGASALQISLLVMLKPVITILSFYWSAGLKSTPKKLKSNMFWAGVLMRAPFLLCPIFHNPWFVILAAVNYMFFYRAGIPAWMEIVKRNMKENKGRIFSLTSALGYGEGVLLALAFGALLDHDPSLWKILFCISAGIGLLSLIFQMRIQMDVPAQQHEKPKLTEFLIRPWRDSYELMRNRADFSRFQWGFMISGFGVMLIQPALPLFAVDILGISYLEMAGAISIAKGLGYVVSSPFWARFIDKVNVLKLSSFVFLIVALFPILLPLSIFGISWLYIAYFFYGVGQGGSHLVWNMSGPIFAGKEESSRYTGVNVVLAGLRGAIAPPLGGWLSVLFGPIQVLLISSVLCFYSGIRLLQSRFAKDPFPIKH